MKQVLEKILEEIALEHPYKIPGQPDTYSPYNEAWQDCIDRVTGAIMNYLGDLPDTNIGGWIPVSERLPEKEYDTVLCVTDDDYYFVAVYTSEHMFRTGDIGADVSRIVAWCQLPELYRESDGGNHEH